MVPTVLRRSDGCARRGTFKAKHSRTTRNETKDEHSTNRNARQRPTMLPQAREGMILSYPLGGQRADAFSVRYIYTAYLPTRRLLKQRLDRSHKRGAGTPPASLRRHTLRCRHASLSATNTPRRAIRVSYPLHQRLSSDQPRLPQQNFDSTSDSPASGGRCFAPNTKTII